MRIILFTTTHWNDSASAKRPDIVDPLFGLRAWLDRGTFLFRPIRTFLACGTWSDPAFNPVSDGAYVVNSGIPCGLPYDVFRNQYWMAACTAAMAHVLDRDDWDFVVFLDTDCLVGAVDFPRLFAKFAGRPEVLISNAWGDCPGGPLLVFKRAGCLRFLHYRTQGNMAAARDLKLGEVEMKDVYEGVWWNPWPGVNVRQDYPSNPANSVNPMAFFDSPFIRQPHPAVIQPFLARQWPRAVPL